MVGDSPEGVVRWTQQHGMRAVWDAVPTYRKKAIENELIAEAAAQTDGTDRITFGFPIAYFLATAPRTAAGACPFTTAD